MQAKQNCWEFRKCGREPHGLEAMRLGVCPAAADTSAHGLNGGKNGGRICWAVAGTFSSDIRGTFAGQKLSCVTCDFFKLVEEECKDDFTLLKPGQVFFHY